MFKLRPPYACACLALAACLPAGSQADPLLGYSELPTVLTATRLRQAPAEVPGSMTVLDRELIRASGARDVPELLRLVPGMKIGYLSGHRSNVNYHGTNTTEARRMQVLVDGRSVYRPGLATVDWNDIPLAIEDIERIEVFRGPNTASYGANALMGVINIISVSPENYHGTRVRVTRGDRGVRDLYGSQALALGAATRARLSLFAKEDDGFDVDQFDMDYRDSRRLSAFTFASSTELSPTRVMDWQAGVKEGSGQRPYDYSPLAPGVNSAFAYDRAMQDHRPDSDMTARDYFARVHFKQDVSEWHQLEIKAYAQHMERLGEWRACDTLVAFSPELRELNDINPVYTRRMTSYFSNRHGWDLPRLRREVGDANFPLVEEAAARYNTARDEAPTCFDLDKNLRETRYEAEVQNTLRLSDNLRSVVGINLREDRASSVTFFGGVVSNRIAQLFSSLEYRPHHRWLLHAGAMAEQDRLSGSSISPRVAAQYFVRPTHSLRAVYSEAVRSPDMYENKAYWTYRASNPSGPPPATDQYYALATGPGNLKQERMRSAELGYNGYFHGLALTIDVKAFHDEIHDMISEPLQVINFVPSNDNFARFKGGETQLDWRATTADRVRLTYAYVDFVATRTQDQRLTARHSGSAAWIRQWPGRIESSLIYYGADTLNERRFERLDGRLAKGFGLGEADATLALTWQHRLDDEALTWSENLFNSRNHYYLSAELNF